MPIYNSSYKGEYEILLEEYNEREIKIINLINYNIYHTFLCSVTLLKDGDSAIFVRELEDILGILSAFFYNGHIVKYDDRVELCGVYNKYKFYIPLQLVTKSIDL